VAPEESVLRRLLVAQSLSEIEALQSRWEALHRQQDETTIFQSFHWNRLAAAIFHQERPYVVYLETDAGAALIPAAIRNSRELCLLGEELFDYRDILSMGDFCVLAEAWQTLAESRLPLAPTPIRGPAARKHWSAFELAGFCKAPYVSADLTAEAFAGSHTRLGRQIRRLERAGVSMARHGGDKLSLLRQIYAHKAAPSNICGRNLFQEDHRVRFVLAVAANAPSACQIFTLESPSTLVAAIVTLEDGGVRRFYTTWFHPAWSRYSPGIALLFEATRLSLAEGLDCDYMTGAQDYKLRLASGAVPLYRASGAIRNSSPRAAEAELPVAN
jgi:CelD/BcsL family acetyltransferase involved in cellulose biosynthesis